MNPFSLPDMMTRPRIDLARRPGFDALDDRAQLLEWPAAERVLAFILAVEDGPGDAPLIDGESPVLESGSGRDNALNIAAPLAHTGRPHGTFSAHLLCRGA